MDKKVYAVNPYLPACNYIPDGEPHVFGDRLYIYGSHDRFNGQNFCELDYECWSAPVEDLGNWRCEGIMYRRDQDPDNKDSAHACMPRMYVRDRMADIIFIMDWISQV